MTGALVVVFGASLAFSRGVMAPPAAGRDRDGRAATLELASAFHRDRAREIRRNRDKEV
jgi:hypothetical protein